jgi:hypothetical protein
MMKKLVVVIIFLATLTFGALNYHFILMDNGIKILKKVDLTFDDTLVNARGAKKYKLLLNPALVKAGVNDLLKKEGVTIGK